MRIKSNHTQEEILNRYEERKSHDFMGFEVNIYLDALDYDHLKPMLAEDGTPEWWAGYCAEVPEGTPVEAIVDYMPFAWEKANNFRGLSAGRSLYHMVAWIWLNEEGDFAEEILNDARSYHFYGKDVLVKICQHYGIDHKQYDDGVRLDREPV